MVINKDTKLFGSFSQLAGNKGCEFFNEAFQRHNINAIYKSFSVNNIEDAFKAAKTLNMGGFAVASPYKMQMYQMILIDSNGCFGNSTNTVIKTRGKYLGYNTDYLGVKNILEEYTNKFPRLYIIGNGGLANTVRYTWSEQWSGNYKSAVIITRELIGVLNDLSGCLIYNCSPGDYTYLAQNNTFIDCRIGTPDGDKLYEMQAKAQFKLYTGIDYE